MNEEHNNEMELSEENTILGLVDAHAKSDGLSHSSGTDDGHEYDELFTLFTGTRNALKPDAALLRKTLLKLPGMGGASQLDGTEVEAVPSPYGGTVSWLSARVSSWKVATPVIVLFIAVAALIGAAPKKGQAPTTSPTNQEVLAPLATLRTAEPSTFAEAPVDADAAPQMMMMSKMSLTTVPSTTPQNVGELIALLSNEADGDVDLGVTDMNDPLYSVDEASVDALQQSYDIQTI